MKCKYYVLLALCLCSAWAQAQLTPQVLSILGKNPARNEKKAESLLLQALSPEVSIIRQQYRLMRGSDYYGKNNRSYYGESYSLGVKVSGGTIMLENVVEPWKDDADYQRVSASGDYKPSMYWSYQRNIQDSIYHQVELGLNFVKPLNEEKSLYIHKDELKDFGLSIDESAGQKNGYMIWVYSTTNLQDSTMSVNFVQSPYQVDASADSTVYHMAPADPEKLLGGIFVVPQIERGGRLQFFLVGVAAPNSEKKWNLHLLTTELSPLPKEKGDKRKKKDDTISEGESESEPTPIKK